MVVVEPFEMKVVITRMDYYSGKLNDDTKKIILW